MGKTIYESDNADSHLIQDADDPMSASVIKRTRLGWLEGERKALVTEDGHFFSFKGIPYAKPPFGSLRFKAPEPPAQWTGIRKATKHGPICPQKKLQRMECHDCIGNEDCLYLNVYTPNMEPSNLLPVMVFIHGGGLRYGSGDEQDYGPDFLVKQGVLLVTFNYRLNTFGFLCLDSMEVPGNAGFKDQVAALRWVQCNIEDYGGDPNNVTIFGESSAGVALHVVSPMSANLFKRAVLLGGIPMCDWSVDVSPRSRAVTLAYLLGLEVENPDSDQLLKFLQSLSVDDIIVKAPCLFRSEDMHNFVLNMSHYSSVVEKDFGQERFLIEDPEESLMNGNVNRVDVMTGYANMSASDRIGMLMNLALNIYKTAPELFVPRRILKDASKHKILDIANKIRDHYFGEKSTTHITLKEFVRFCGVSERSIYTEESREKYGIVGASQSDLMLHLFEPKNAGLKLDKESKGYKLIQMLSTITTNFAKFGKPFVDDCYSNIVWCEYDYFAESYMDIDVDLNPGAALNDDVVDFWKSLYEYAGVKMEM
ncbi:hypothetical protein MSG28_009909 [Choristoneura fumiferana]|uniref:Uncharacterized protein n=1 Tax=Choristoneura fumiferana TaxID=7141 RepID=A0ACC0JD32_CHOFU|nr:hypothetical protein MSG28_009909 [Choristoneura fumiferana]